MRKLGDKPFAELAKKESRETRHAVARDIAYDLELFGDDSKRDTAAAREKYPLTFAAWEIEAAMKEVAQGLEK